MFDEVGLTVTNYVRPDGRAQELFITKINREQVDFFTSNKISVSMEDCGVCFAIYAAPPHMDEDEPTELTYLVDQDETCYIAMERLQKLCEEAYDSGYWPRPV